MSISLKTVFYELSESGICIIRIYNPPANMTNIQFFDELYNLLSNEIYSMSIKGILLTGEGRSFSAGADIPELIDCFRRSQDRRIQNIESSTNIIPEFYLKERRIIHLLMEFEKPIVCCINGLCIGSGFELALSCHVRVAKEKSLVGLPESGFGLMPGLGGSIHYFREFGIGKALELILSGKLLSAEEAYNMNLVHAVKRKEELFQYAYELTVFLSKLQGYDKERYKEYIKKFEMQYSGLLINNK